MDLVLSWDLLVIVFFGVVITYSLIIGKDQSVKVIIASYIAIVAAQGLGNLFHRISGDTQPLFNLIGVNLDISLHAGAKLFLFVLAIIFLAARGGFEVDYMKKTSGATDMLLTICFGFVTAGLLLSTLMTFVANVPLLDANIATHESIVEIVNNSKLMAIMVLNQDIWFALPAIFLLTIGILSNRE